MLQTTQLCVFALFNVCMTVKLDRSMSRLGLYLEGLAGLGKVFYVFKLDRGVCVYIWAIGIEWGKVSVVEMNWDFK